MPVPDKRTAETLAADEPENQVRSFLNESRSSYSKVSEQSLTAGPEETWRQSIARAIIGDEKPSPELANMVKGLLGTTGIGETGMGLVDITPAGIAMQVEEAIRRGDAQGAAMAVMPVPGAPGIKAAGKKAKTAAAQRLRNLRKLPFDEALAVSKRGEHLVPKEGGGFEGAPAWVKTEEDLQKLRADFDRQVDEGFAGGTWYQDAQGGIVEMAGADPAKQHLAAGELKITSSQANPRENLGFTLAGHNAYEAGAPLRTQMRSGAVARTYTEGRATGNIKGGSKTDPYGQHIDPTAEDPTTGANDIWHARAFGFTDPKTGKPWDKSLSAAQHNFMDAETILAVERANAKNLGGRSDWKAGEIQAMPWVANKAKDLNRRYPKKYPTMEAAMEEAVKTYKHHLGRFTAHGTYEAIPYAAGKHHEGMVNASAADREAWTSDPRELWTNQEGRDILYDAMGMYQRKTNKASGVYTAPGGELETNPAGVARPLVGMTGKTGEREVDPSSAAMMSMAESVRAYLTGQGAGAWSKPVYGVKASKVKGVEIKTSGPLSREQIIELKSKGEVYGLTDVIDYGDSVVLTSFSRDIDRRAINHDLAIDTHGSKGIGDETLFEAEFGRVIPGAKAELVGLDSDYLAFEGTWEQGVGSGAATRQLMEYLTKGTDRTSAAHAPAIIEKLDKSPELRQKAMDLFYHSNEREAMMWGPAREDLQNARKIFSESGFAGLFKALEKGSIALPVGLLILAPALQEAQGGS